MLRNVPPWSSNLSPGPMALREYQKQTHFNPIVRAPYWILPLPSYAYGTQKSLWALSIELSSSRGKYFTAPGLEVSRCPDGLHLPLQTLSLPSSLKTPRSSEAYHLLASANFSFLPFTDAFTLPPYLHVGGPHHPWEWSLHNHGLSVPWPPKPNLFSPLTLDTHPWDHISLPITEPMMKFLSQSPPIILLITLV